MEIKEKIRNFLDENNWVVSISAKRKMKIFVLMYIASKFESNKKYSKKEINLIIISWTTFNEPATIRRELYNNRFINSEDDCSVYWLEKSQQQLSNFGIEE